jgi:hypothetical protein
MPQFRRDLEVHARTRDAQGGVVVRTILSSLALGFAFLLPVQAQIPQTTDIIGIRPGMTGQDAIRAARARLAMSNAEPQQTAVNSVRGGGRNFTSQITLSIPGEKIELNLTEHGKVWMVRRVIRLREPLPRDTILQDFYAKYGRPTQEGSNVLMSVLMSGRIEKAEDCATLAAVGASDSYPILLSRQGTEFDSYLRRIREMGANCSPYVGILLWGTPSLWSPSVGEIAQTSLDARVFLEELDASLSAERARQEGQQRALERQMQGRPRPPL